MSKNRNLQKARKAKNDEFYTRIEDIEKELVHYKDHFKDKIIYMNCDNPEVSNFWKYFYLNFKHFGLKKIISTHYDAKKPTYKWEYDGKDVLKESLEQNGDFRSPESIELLKKSDIVVTNPPFSLFREYIDQLMEYNKKFVIIGNKNAISYKEIFKLMKNNEIWLGYTSPKEFLQPDGTMKKFGNIGWFTNLEISKRNEELILHKKYYGNEQDYPKYDNYNAINVDKVSDIPYDYEGYIGVPITFLDKFNPNQFEIICIDFEIDSMSLKTLKTGNWNGKFDRGYIKGQRKYSRIIIKNKHPKKEI